MVSTWSRTSCSRSQTVLVILVILLAGFASACGSSSNPNPGSGQHLTGNSNVTIAVSSTANDALSQFDLTIQSLTLTSQSGNTVIVLSGQWPAEFIHVNGAIEPITTVTLPQGIYTSATAVIGAANFTCVTVQPPNSPVAPGYLTESTFSYGHTPNANVTVNLPSPITITGADMALLLNLQVSQSASYPSTCYEVGIGPYAITPTFNLTAATLSAQPTSPANGKISELEGAVTAVGTTGNSFTLSSSEPETFSVGSDNNTVYQGISGFSALRVGMLVDMDGAIQPDGSILASRIASYDPPALNVMIGPLLQLPGSAPHFYSFPLDQQGQTYNTQSQSMGVYSYSGSTLFQISGQLSNLRSLPFVASFDPSHMVTGQNVAIFSQQITDYYGGQYTAATTMTLMPQTINGTVVASSSSGSFTDYTVSLASYDLFPTLAAQPGENNSLANPSQVEVYVDADTELLNMQGLVSGSTLRFYGLVFNDNGTLRMDCARVNDGVTDSTQPNSPARRKTGQQRRFVYRGSNGMIQAITSVTRSQ